MGERKQELPTRDGFGKAIVDEGKESSDLWVLSADVSSSTRTHWFEKEFPERFVQVGVAEQNMAGVAAGIASTGKRVAISAYGVFSPGRNWDQIRVSICYNNLPVLVHGSHTGLNVGPDGATHQALEDIAITRCLPNMVVCSPCDFLEAYRITRELLKRRAPAYLRTTRGKVPQITTEPDRLEIGKANVLVDGSDIALACHGGVVHECIKASEILKDAGISASVVNFHTIKPLDKGAVDKMTMSCGTVVSVEEHQITGGLGSAICERVAETGKGIVKRIGMKDSFGESGSGKELIKKYGLDSKSIAKKCAEILDGVS